MRLDILLAWQPSNGVNTGKRLAAAVSTAVIVAVLWTLEQSVITIQLPVSCSARALSLYDRREPLFF